MTAEYTPSTGPHKGHRVTVVNQRRNEAGPIYVLDDHGDPQVVFDGSGTHVAVYGQSRCLTCGAVWYWTEVEELP